MQRRLTFAFVAMALASIVLLGSGVLALSQLGARRNAEAEMSERLEAFVEASNESSLQELARTLDQSRRFYNLSEVQVLTVGDDGGLSPAIQAGSRNRAPQRQRNFDRLDASQLSSFQEGVPVFVGDERAVTGLIRVQPETSARRLQNSELAILASQPIPLIQRQGTLSYLVSAALVLLLSVFVAWLLAQRLVRPIKEVQLATAEIAKGHLQTRVEPRGSDELGQLAQSVNRMAADLQRSKDLDRQFLMSVSHDLRTPLTAMRGFGEALADGTATSPSEAGQVIVNHADRLNRLVTDLIDLARLDANTFQLDLKPTNLAVVAGRTVAGLQEAATQKSVVLSFEEAAPSEPGAQETRLDVDRVGQVITNLVHNAIKFAETTVVVRVYEEGAGATQLEVTDDGPGISPEDLPHIFERLYTTGKNSTRPSDSENRSPVTEGSGLGLAIVRELVDAMGGQIEARSTPGAGTQMLISFPLHND